MPAHKSSVQNASSKSIGANVKNSQLFFYKTTSSTYNVLIAISSYKKMKAVTISLVSVDTSFAINVEESGKDPNIYV